MDGERRRCVKSVACDSGPIGLRQVDPVAVHQRPDRQHDAIGARAEGRDGAINLAAGRDGKQPASACTWTTAVRLKSLKPCLRVWPAHQPSNPRKHGRYNMGRNR